MSQDQIKQIAVILSPNTIFRFHQLLINRKYHILFSSNKNRNKLGPKGPSREIIDAILEMKKRNPRMGCPKIALTISKIFGIEIDKDIVRRILKKYYHPSPFDHGGPSWLTFLGHAKEGLLIFPKVFFISKQILKNSPLGRHKSCPSDFDSVLPV